MSALMPLAFEDRLIRIVEEGGQQLFVAQDVCAALGITKARDAVARIPSHQRVPVKLAGLGGLQEVWAVTQGGMYVLTVRCRDATKEGTLPYRFLMWLTDEVIPSLQRTGRYTMPDAANDVGDCCPPLDGSAMDEERRLMLSLAVVREARQVWGRGQARRIWQQLGLPDGCAKLNNAMQVQKIASAANEADETITGWLAERCHDGEGVTGSRELFADYEAWCRDREAGGVTMTKFGLTLHGLGYKPLKIDGGRIGRVGLLLN